MAAYDIYSAQLLQLKHGYALWSPEPWAYSEVQVGDVGYIWRGSFYRLFNVILGSEHPDNKRFGVPDGFKPLNVPPDSTYRVEKYFDPGPLHSCTVSRFECDISTAGSVALAGAGIQFSCSKSQGAVLFLRRRAIREDTCSRMDFKDYILQNYRSWYHFANDRLRRGVKSGQIMLVTGCDKTAEWASAVFADRNRSAGITFSGGVPTIASGELTISGSWEYSPSVQYRTGPTCDSTVKYDQTVFIRGYRIRERPILAPKVIQAAAEPRAPGSKDRDLDPDAIAPDLDTTELEYVPDDAAGFHPADALLAYILDHSDQPVALVHDDEWCQGVPYPSMLDDTLKGQVAKVTVESIIDAYSKQYFQLDIATEPTSLEDTKAEPVSPPFPTLRTSANVGRTAGAAVSKEMLLLNRLASLGKQKSSFTRRIEPHMDSTPPKAVEYGSAEVQSRVTSLLVNIKQLLESLTLWSNQKGTETHVNDAYVAFGDGFNATTDAFAAIGISLDEIQSYPDEIRAILEDGLSKEATPDNLQFVIPEVRAIISKLLQVLRQKQTLLRARGREHAITAPPMQTTDS